MLTAALLAALTIPTGFVSHPALARHAAQLAGKPVTVLCASTDEAWQAEEQTRANGGTDVLARTDAVSGSVIYLSPQMCGPLLWGKPKKAHDLLRLQGAAIEVLAHESAHLAGVENEGEAECRALATVPRLARLLKIKDKTRLRWIINGANARHRAAIAYSPAYRGNCDT